MSKLARTLMLCAMLAAMSLAAATANAQEGTAAGDAAEHFRAGERASQSGTITSDPAELFRAGERASRVHHSDVGPSPAKTPQPTRPAESGRPIGLLVTLGVLTAALAAVAVRRATRVRPRQAV
jgi:hypothetical protein